MRRLTLLLLPLLLAAALRAEEASPTEVSGARALEILKILSSDAFRGRKSGLESGTVAERYMADRLKEIGLTGGIDGDFFHVFHANTTEEGASAALSFSGGEGEPAPATYLEDFVTLLYSGRGDVQDLPVVFAGYGIPARGDYEGIDPAGKLVLAVRGKPEGTAFDEEAQIGWKSSTARERGAAGFLLVEGEQARPGTIQEKFYRQDLPAVWIGRKFADALLARAGKSGFDAQAGPFELEGVRASLHVDARLIPDAEMRNVVALWRCKDDARHPDEYVVCGAHLDHVGVDGAGNVYNGADDNASGSSMLFEVARAVAATGERFERNVYFVWFAGEEQGLLGSRAFVEKPPVPVERMAAMFNTDMVGQGKPVLVLGGAEVYPRDAEWLDAHQLPGQEVQPFRSSPNSDHWPFQGAGVPAFFLLTRGPHPNYHMPADDWPNIDPDLLERAGRYLRTMLARAANAERPLCRADRKGEYVWNASPVCSLHAEAPAPGVDLRVVWLEGGAAEVMNGLDLQLTLREEERIPELVYVPDGSAPLDRQLDDLRPTALLGLRGGAALEVARPAARLGATVFAPWMGTDPAQGDPADLDALCAEKGLLLVLEGAPESVDPAAFKAPLVLTREQAARAKADARWVAVVPLDPTRAPADVAKDLAQAVSTLGETHVVVAPGGDDAFHAAVVQAMLDAGLPQPRLTPLLGGNLVRMLQERPTPRKPTPKAPEGD